MQIFISLLLGIPSLIVIWAARTEKREDDSRRCIDCGEITDNTAFGGKHICKSCLNSRVERAIAWRRQAEIKATTPPGPSEGCLWILAIALFIVALIVIPH